MFRDYRANFQGPTSTVSDGTALSSMKTKEGLHMLRKWNVATTAVGLVALLLTAPASQAGPHHHGHGLLPHAAHRHHGYQFHAVQIRSHGFYGHHRYHGHRPGYGLAAVTLGVVGGTVLGAAIAHAASPPVVVSPAHVVYSQPVVVTTAPQTQTFQALQSQAAMPALGTVYSALPSGCSLELVQGQNYYRCGSYWYLPQLGPQGVQYLFVAPPA